MKGIKNKQILKAVKLINLSIISFIIDKKGTTTLLDVENYTGLKNISLDIIANLLAIMAKKNEISLNKGGKISASVAKLKKIMRDEKMYLPSNFGQMWNEEDYVKLAELQMEGKKPFAIGKAMERTEDSVNMQSHLIRKAYKLMGIIERNPVVLEFVKITSTPDAIIKNKSV